jgi:hypothetical protein
LKLHLHWRCKPDANAGGCKLLNSRQLSTLMRRSQACDVRVCQPVSDIERRRGNDPCYEVSWETVLVDSLGPTRSDLINRFVSGHVFSVCVRTGFAKSWWNIAMLA